MPPIKNVVLVHGAFADGSGWRSVYDLLTADGYRVSVTQHSTITLEGVEFPAPADPEAMMVFLYGEHWRVPDPAFRYADPVEGVRRLDGWLRGFRTEQPRWNRWYLANGPEVPRKGSSFASIFTAPFEHVLLPLQRQGESIAYTADGRALVVTSEQIPAPLWRLTGR